MTDTTVDSVFFPVNEKDEIVLCDGDGTVKVGGLSNMFYNRGK